MPKVTIDSTKGLVQKSGGGFAPLGEVQSITANAAGDGTAVISSSSSVVLGDSVANNHKITLPLLADVEVGHMLLVCNIDAAEDFSLETAAGDDKINGANAITLGEGTRALCFKVSSTSWQAVISA